MGLGAVVTPVAILDVNHTEMLAAFKLTLSAYPGPAKLRDRLATVASVTFADATTLRFRSLTGAHCELRRAGDQVVASLID